MAELTEEELAVLAEARDGIIEEPEEEEVSKQKSALHKEMLEALKAEQVDARLIARSIKSLLSSSDVADVRAGVQAYTKIMVEEHKERTSKKGGSGVVEKRYLLNLPQKEK